VKASLICGAVAAALAVPAAASATIVNIAGDVTGCVSSATCGGSPHLQPGDQMSALINPVQVDFAAGTYTVTNAVGLAGATPGFDAWRFNGSESNWIWSFEIIDDATKKVVLDSLVPPYTGVFVGDHASVAASDYALNYSGSFTLAAGAKLDFITEDYYPYDNAGGVALKIVRADAGSSNAVPEPATWSLMIAGFGLAGAALRRRSAAAA